MPQNHAEIIQKLSYSAELLPEEALHDALKYYDDIKPELHAALQLSPKQTSALDSEDGDVYSLQFFAMYLAAEKRDTDAFPLIRDFFAQYGEAADNIAGEMVCEHLDRILASVCQDAEALKSAAELPGLSTWPRSAFFGSLGILFQQGYLARTTLVDWFQTWLEQDDLDIDSRTTIAFSCCDLALHELEANLLEALKNGQIDHQSMNSKDITDNIQRDKIEAFQQKYYDLDPASDRAYRM